MIVNTESLHYYLLKTYGKGRPEYYYEDSCSYIKGVFKVALKLIFFTLFVGAGCCLFVGDFLAWIAACITIKSLLVPEPFASIVIIIFGSILALILCAAISDAIKRKTAHKEPVHKEPGFFKQTYNHLHNKFCTRVVFVHNRSIS